MKILHIMILDKFIPNFIEFVDKHFGRENHKYVLITSEKYNYGLKKEHEVEFLHTDNDIFTTLVQYMKETEKIVLHGLWREKVNLILKENPLLLKKCFWIMWGGDFYFPQKQSELQKYVIENVPYLVTGTKGEVDYAKNNYNAKGEHIEAFVYTSNLFKNIESSPKIDDKIRILIGNSSTETNRHFKVFNKLEIYRNENIEIFVPLSYGDFKYGMQVMKVGYEIFGNKFKPIIDFMNEQDYYKFLSTIDIGIFNHNRQQGMGNIITLLGMGKKVYMNPEVTTYEMFIDNNIFINDVNNFILDTTDINLNTNNIYNIERVFSTKNFIFQLKQFL
jgi:dTDP-N-acetylfucosamine:lipid II N-acetylfucosaminyltransferase